MEGLMFSILKVFLSILACIGLIFHLLTLKSLEAGRKAEEKLGTKLGVKKEFIPWLEKGRMGLHERLIRSRAYNTSAIIFLIILLVLLFQT
ncbi:MAG: hypothetical protein ABIE81_01890 [Candidatus Omnitrophota bacterium]